MMKKTLKSNAGFSLVELMVVVAIIGILATLAVPQVNKFMAKARQSEAKTNLTGIFTSNKAFFVEYNTYASYFGAIGYAPEGQLRYNTGFTAAGPAAAPSGWNVAWPPAVAASATITTVAYCPLSAPAAPFKCTVLAEGQGANGTLPAAAGAPTATTFTAGAASRIFSGAVQSDHWTVTHNKTFANVQDGIN